MIQVETAVAGWVRDRADGVQTDELGIGETAVKFGLTERFHIEVDIAPYSRVRTDEGEARETLSGFGDMGVAAKYRLTGDEAPSTETASPPRDAVVRNEVARG